MPVAAGISAAGSLAGSVLGYFGSQNASNAQVAAQQAALAQQKQMFGVLQGAAQPLINTGQGIIGGAGNILSSGQNIVDTGLGYAKNAAGTLTSLLTPGANMTAALSQIPGFEFAQDWGQKAVQNLGTTMGLGGNTLKAGADYATGAAQQGFGNIVNSLLGLLGGGNNLLNAGTGVMSTGTNLTGVGGNIASSGVNALSYGAGQFSGQSSNTLGNIGNAQASGVLGGTNALAGGVGGVANAASLPAILAALRSGGQLGPGGLGLNPTANPSGIYSGGGGGIG